MIDFKVNFVADQFSGLRNLIRTYPEKIAHDIYFPQLTQIAEEGAEVIRFVIATASTRTGQEQGREGRIDTGAMIDSVGSRVNQNKLSLSALAGFIENSPGYTIYQEQGTSRITAMDSIPQAREYMLSRIRGL